MLSLRNPIIAGIGYIMFFKESRDVVFLAATPSGRKPCGPPRPLDLGSIPWAMPELQPVNPTRRAKRLCTRSPDRPSLKDRPLSPPGKGRPAAPANKPARPDYPCLLVCWHPLSYTPSGKTGITCPKSTIGGDYTRARRWKKPFDTRGQRSLRKSHSHVKHGSQGKISGCIRLPRTEAREKPFSFSNPLANVYATLGRTLELIT